jgi:hypothetical protein
MADIFYQVTPSPPMSSESTGSDGFGSKVPFAQRKARLPFNKKSAYVVADPAGLASVQSADDRVDQPEMWAQTGTISRDIGSFTLTVH